AQLAMSKFCSNYASQMQSARRSNSYESTLVSRAFDSFDKCISLCEKGVTVTHGFDSASRVNVFLQPAINRPLVLSGVYTSPNVSCRGQGVDGTPIDFNAQTHLEMKFGSISIICDRQPKDSGGAGGVIFEEGTITLATSEGNYPIYLQ